MKLILLLTTTWALTISANLTDCETNYYWLDYLGGAMPPSVLPVDLTTTSQLNYVGQLYTKQYELLPASVRTSLRYATSHAYNSIYTASTQIKVLASQCKANFQWVPTSAAEYDSVPYLVPAGSELGKQLFFGRLLVNGTQVLGKVNSGYKGITVPWNGIILEANASFSILAYRPPSEYGCVLNNTDLKESLSEE